MKLQWNKRTLLYGGGIALLVILFLVLRSGSAGATVVSNSSGQPTDAEVAANTQLQLAQIGAAEKASEFSANLALGQAQIQGDLDKSQIEADLARYQIDAQSAQATQAAQTAHDQLVYQAQSQEYLDDLQASITKYQLDTTAAMQANNNAFQLDYAEAANQTQVSLATIQSQIVQQQLEANRDVTMAQLEASANALANSLQTQVSLADIEANKEISQSNISAKVQKHQSDNNLIGGIVGGILSIF